MWLEHKDWVEGRSNVMRLENGSQPLLWCWCMSQTKMALQNSRSLRQRGRWVFCFMPTSRMQLMTSAISWRFSLERGHMCWWEEAPWLMTISDYSESSQLPILPATKRMYFNSEAKRDDWQGLHSPHPGQQVHVKWRFKVGKVVPVVDKVVCLNTQLPVFLWDALTGYKYWLTESRDSYCFKRILAFRSGWDSSHVKNTCCSCRRVGSVPSTHIGQFLAACNSSF